MGQVVVAHVAIALFFGIASLPALAKTECIGDGEYRVCTDSYTKVICISDHTTLRAIPIRLAPKRGPSQAAVKKLLAGTATGTATP
ncbi:hypothetical protein GGE45_001476 [Rhizobium aethiopicum]|nr:hypothetical protein [Rhizobium aethiopicum]